MTTHRPPNRGNFSTVFRTDSDPAGPSGPSGLAALYVQADLLDLKAWKMADCFITEYVVD